MIKEILIVAAAKAILLAGAAYCLHYAIPQLDLQHAGGLVLAGHLLLSAHTFVQRKG